MIPIRSLILASLTFTLHDFTLHDFMFSQFMSSASVCFARCHTHNFPLLPSPSLLVNLYFMRSKYLKYPTFSSLCPLVTWTSTLSTLSTGFQFQSLFSLSMTAITRMMTTSSQINVINDYCRVMCEGE